MPGGMGAGVYSSMASGSAGPEGSSSGFGIIVSVSLGGRGGPGASGGKGIAES